MKGMASHADGCPCAACAALIANLRPCAQTGCPRFATVRGLCRSHYRRWQRGGALATGAIAPPDGTPTFEPGWHGCGDRPQCAQVSCELLAATRGLCPTHYLLRKRGGTVKTTTKPEGCGHQVRNGVAYCSECLWEHAGRPGRESDGSGPAGIDGLFLLPGQARRTGGRHGTAGGWSRLMGAERLA